ncbi:hypothetical protein F5887DRAFT_1086843 [Amanita rubescens]|nr:hypothetical protein F5887DRAFT_1086843 [Amanita rubescens]
MFLARCLQRRAPCLTRRLLRTSSYYGFKKAISRPALNTKFNARLSSTLSAADRLAGEGIETDLDKAQIEDIVKNAKSAWPPPPSIPSGGWSSEWEHWPYLLTFYWSSPYFLMLPQIEMIANILYNLRGETRPLLFSNSRNQFVFTLFQEPTRFFLYDVNKQFLAEFDNVTSEEELVLKMDEDPEVLPLTILSPNPEGESAIRRILDRDETVIPVLAENFLDYTPQATEPSQENLSGSPFATEDEDEFRDLILEKVDEALKDGKTELTEEEQWKIIEEVTKELGRRSGGSGKDETG